MRGFAFGMDKRAQTTFVSCEDGIVGGFADHDQVGSWLLLRESLQVTAAGLAVGMIMALISAGFMESLLFGLKPRDPLTFGGALLTVVVVALAASFLPARQAASIAPMQALRTE